MTSSNSVLRGWRYLSAWFDTVLEEKADPRIQIEQAVREAQHQHQALTRQAAAVIGNRRQLELQLDRQLDTVARLAAQARQALVLADQARAGADDSLAAAFDDTALALANQLVSAETAVDDLKALYEQAVQAADEARQAVHINSVILQQQLADRAKLLSQLEQAKMQERVAASLQQMNDIAAPTDVPTLGEVRTKIERRYAAALGQTELARDMTGARMLAVQRAAIEMEGTARLEEIRASLTAAPIEIGSGARLERDRQVGTAGWQLGHQ